MSAPRPLVLAMLASLALVPACDPTGSDRGTPPAAADPADLEPVDSEKLDGPLARFDRNLLLDDALFTDAGALDAAAVQAFLEQTPYGRRSFLADEQVDGVPFSQVLVETAAAYEINPVLLLVRLQVEHSLVSKSSRPADDVVDFALGCGCPDGTSCDPARAGMATQLDCGAATLRTHYDGSLDGSGAWRRGNAKRTQDRITVTPGSHATASLYAYTPWVLENTGGNWLVWNVTRKYVSSLVERGLWHDDGGGEDGGETMPAAGSCAGHCGSGSAVSQGDGHSCFCDEACGANGDCCDDYAAACEGGGGEMCSFEADPGTAARVHVVYLVPSDREVREDYRASLVRATRDLQLWYASQMPDGSTFSVHEDVVDVLHTEHPASWYSTHESGDAELWFWNNVLADGFPLTGADFNQEFDVWAFYIDADGACGQIAGSGTSGVSVMPANDLRGLVGEGNIPPCPQDAPDDGGRCRWVGGLGHELGHAFGRPHPQGCDAPVSGVQCDTSALLWLGYASYPDAHLTAADRSALGSSRFFETIDLPSCSIDCSVP